MIMYNIIKTQSKIELELPNNFSIKNTDTEYVNNLTEPSISIKRYKYSHEYERHTNIAIQSIILYALKPIKQLTNHEISVKFKIDDNTTKEVPIPDKFTDDTLLIDNPLYIREFVSGYYITDLVKTLLYDLGVYANAYNELIQLTEISDTSILNEQSTAGD